MSFLLDTNAVSEFVKTQPNAGLLRWLSTADEENLFLSVVTIAEIRLGIETAPSPAMQKTLSHWLAHDLLNRFFGRILAIDVPVADEWATIIAARRSAGRPIQAMDALIAATANVHGLTLVTRDARDFAGSAKAIHDPWQ